MNVREHFPIFTHQPNLVYLDSAATALKPQSVIDMMAKYYEQYSANIHRGVYDLSAKATQEYENARDTVAQFLHASREEIIFTSGATGSLNMVARSLESIVRAGDNIVLTAYEHHANLISWQHVAKKVGATLRFIPLGHDYSLDMKAAGELIDTKTKIVSFAPISNALGTFAHAKELIGLAKNVGAITILDAAQSVVYRKTDVKELDCDFLVFSGHKLYGPTGIGVLYGKKALLDSHEPSVFGGSMVDTVTYEQATWADLPNKFEAGTPHIAGAIGLAAAIQFVESIGWGAITSHEKDICIYAIEQLSLIKGVRIIGSKDQTDRVGIVSFTVEGIHPHDVAEILNGEHVAVRAGHHCTMPLMQTLGLPGTVRLSIGMYNTREDIDALTVGLRKAISIFNNT